MPARRLSTNGCRSTGGGLSEPKATPNTRCECCSAAESLGYGTAPNVQCCGVARCLHNNAVGHHETIPATPDSSQYTTNTCSSNHTAHVCAHSPKLCNHAIIRGGGCQATRQVHRDLVGGCRLGCIHGKGNGDSHNDHQHKSVPWRPRQAKRAAIPVHVRLHTSAT